MKSASDQDLLLALKNDDHRSFRCIYEKYWEKLYKTACKRLDDELDAEEVTQNVFCNLWRNRSDLDLRTNFESYLSVAVKYEIINNLAKRTHARTYQYHAMITLSELENTTSDTIDFHELRDQIQHSVNCLPEKCQKVFKLSREDGQSIKQISELLEISPKTVEAHIAKALKTLRTTVGSIMLFLF